MRGRPRRKRANEKSASGRPGIPDCPEYLSKEAKAKWSDLIRDLEGAGIIVKADADTMARYCETWASWRRANDWIQKLGEVYKGPNGGMVQNPYLSIRAKASSEMNKISAQLGLDPASRQRLHVATEPPDTSKDRFFENREGK